MVQNYLFLPFIASFALLKPTKTFAAGEKLLKKAK
jgi:hypothetical protein